MEVKEPSAKYLVKPAFKQTEVGVIPEDWQVCELGALTDPKRPISYGIVQTGPSIQNGVRCLRVVDIDDGRINKADLITTSSAISNAYKRTILKAGDLVIPLRGKVGDVALIDDELAGCNLTRGVALIATLRDHSALYCKHFIAWTATRIRLMQSMNGSALQEIPIAPLRTFEISLPPTLAEQQAIAAALSDADALIESLQQLLAKKRQIKQGAMQELLTGQKRLPGFAGDWKVRRLGDIAHIKTGGRNNEDKVEDGEYPFFVRSANVERINSYSHDCEAILIPGEGNIGSIFHYICGRFDVHQRVYAITQFSSEISGRYVHLYMSKNFGAHAMQNSVKATVDSLRLPTFQEFQISLPPTQDEQTAITTVLSDLDAELAALEAKLTKARALKQGMMQELLTGRIRLVQPQAEVISFPAQAAVAPKKTKPHNRQIEEAVMLGVLAQAFASEQHPLARVRRTKLLYLLHRHIEGVAEGYLKKAAGPYNPKTRYQGGEGIAVKNGYVIARHNGTYEGFIAGDKVAEAAAYFDKWHAPAVRAWLEQFRYTKTDELELLATVDMAMEDQRHAGNPVSPEAVKRIIQSHPEWQAKLEREVFSDANIEWALAECHNLFGD